MSDTNKMEEAYQDLLKRFKKLDANLTMAISAREFLNALNNNDLAVAVNYKHEANALSLMRKMAARDLLLALSRVIEQHKEDRCSLISLIKIREDIDDYVQGNKNIKNAEELGKRGSGTCFRRRLSNIKQKYNLQKITDVRNSILAHSLHLNEDKLSNLKTKIEYQALANLTHELCELVEDFTLTFREGIYCNTSKANVDKKYFSALIKSIINGSKDKPEDY